MYGIFVRFSQKAKLVNFMESIREFPFSVSEMVPCSNKCVDVYSWNPQMLLLRRQQHSHKVSSAAWSTVDVLDVEMEGGSMAKKKNSPRSPLLLL